MCNCCWDFYLTTNRAVRAQNQTPAHTHAHTHSNDLCLRAAAARPLFGLGLYCHSFIYRLYFLLLSLLSGFCAPVFADPVLSQRRPEGTEGCQNQEKGGV